MQQTGQNRLHVEDIISKILTRDFYFCLKVSKDGLVGFHPGTLHQTEIFTETLTRGDPAFIAPYYFPAQDIGSKIGSEQYTGKILYRTPGSGAKYISKQELSNYSSIIQQSMIGINQQFNATFGLAVTWKEVVSKTDVLKGCTFPCNVSKQNGLCCNIEEEVNVTGTSALTSFDYVPKKKRKKLIFTRVAWFLVN